MITTGKFISLWGLSMSAQQHLHIVKLAHLLVVDGDESHLAQTIALHAVMHDIAKAIEGAPLCQLFLGFLDGGGYSEAEATAFIDFNLYHSHILFCNGLPVANKSKYSSSRSWAATKLVFCPARTVCSAAESCDLMTGLL